MKFTKSLAVAIVLTAATCGSAFAVFPDGKPIHLVNPFSAGGAGDIELRYLAPMLEKKLGVPVVVENMTGAGGKICMERMYKAKADGHYVVYNNMPASLLQEHLYNARFKVGEFSFLSNFGRENRFIAVLENSPYKTFNDLYEAAKTKRVSTAVSGLGSSGHLGSVMLENGIGFKHSIVPFEGTAPSKAAFLGGHVDFWIIGYGDVGPMLKDGKVRVLAVLADKREGAYPDIPTLAELGYKNVPVFTARGLCCPPGTPEDVQKILTEALTEVLNTETVKEWAKTSMRSIDTSYGPAYHALYEEVDKMVLDAIPAMKASIGRK